MSQADQTEAKPASRPSWQADSIIAWLRGDAWNIPSPIDLTAQLAANLVTDDLPVSRIRVTIRTLHPLAIGSSFTWSKKTGETVEFAPPTALLKRRDSSTAPMPHYSRMPVPFAAASTFPGLISNFPY